MSCTEAIIEIALMLDLDERALGLVDFILEVGEKYWGFQRATVFGILGRI